MQCVRCGKEYPSRCYFKPEIRTRDKLPGCSPRNTPKEYKISLSGICPFWPTLLPIPKVGSGRPTGILGVLRFYRTLTSTVAA